MANINEINGDILHMDRMNEVVKNILHHPQVRFLPHIARKLQTILLLGVACGAFTAPYADEYLLIHVGGISQPALSYKSEHREMTKCES